MKQERICPICGGSIERCQSIQKRADGMPIYGTRLSLGYRCEDPACGFALAFPFESAVYCAYACEEIRNRTRSLPADERARALLDSLGYCRRSGDDALSQALLLQVNAMFMEALGEILRESKTLLRALSYREPNAQKRRETRCALEVFLRFLELMEDRYPTPKLADEFSALREKLFAIDYNYELGMLALERDIAEAELYFGAGSRAGGIRSRVAYVKYILAGKDESDEDGISQKEVFAELAPYSQEACYEYISRAAVGQDDIAAVLKSYGDREYPDLTADGKLSFIRLALNACIEHYEPALAKLLGRLQASVSRADDRISLLDEAERVLAECSALALYITDRCAEFSASPSERGNAGFSEFSAERSAPNEANALLEYVIGCCMYYRSCFDTEKRFDIEYLRTASGHFSCFLASELVNGHSVEDLEIPSLIGVRDLRRICENARACRRILTAGAGLGEEG